MSRAFLDRHMELRKLGEGDMYELISSLESVWQMVMANIPTDPRQINSDEYEFKYTMREIRLIEDHACSTRRRATAILLDEWGTSGQVRPTLETLQKLVTRLGLYGPMVQIAQLLGDPEPARPQKGPGASVTTNISEIIGAESFENKLEVMDSINSSQLTIGVTHNKNIDRPYNDIRAISKVFPEFVQPTGLRSTRQIETPNMIQFSPNVTEENNNPCEMQSDELPAVINQELFQSPFSQSPIVHVQSATSESTQSTQDSLDNSSSDVPVIVSSMNRSTEESRLSGLSGIGYRYTDLKQMTRGFSDDSDVSRCIGGLIGKGGFGSVYVGFGLDGKPIAIKSLKSEIVDRETLLKQFQAEMEMTCFQHVNIVRVLGYSIDGPEMLIISEYIHGGNLLKKLKDTNFTEAQRFGILLGIANGLQYLHYGTEKKMIHKDVKSANILLTEDCTPKLCDFGLTRTQDYQNTMLIGTSVYMAPEVYHHDITPKMDVYSFGVVVLEILTGLEPVVEYSPGRTKSIQTHVIDELRKKGNPQDITPLLDSRVSDWPLANNLFNLANKCFADRTNRPDTNEICQYLHRINMQYLQEL